MAQRVLSVFGTRPEGIKMAPIIRALARDVRFESVVCNSGQHGEMLDEVLNLFRIAPDYSLSLMRRGAGLTHITTAVLEGVARVIGETNPDWVLVHGDTTTASAAATAAFYAQIPVAHVEAGLRSHRLDSPWPEEANRQIIARLATLHFAPTEAARHNLLAENVDDDAVIVTGNSVVDALKTVEGWFAADPQMEARIASGFRYLDAEKKLILVTGHRRENLAGGLADMCTALAGIARRGDVQIVFPVHPNPDVRSVVQRILGDLGSVFLVPPLAYAEFLWLAKQAELIVSDSGGIQEEAPSLGTPVLVTRDTTERKEALLSGAIRLVGTQPARLAAEIERQLDQFRGEGPLRNPYGDGQAAHRIVETLARWPQIVPALANPDAMLPLFG